MNDLNSLWPIDPALAVKFFMEVAKPGQEQGAAPTITLTEFLEILVSLVASRETDRVLLGDPEVRS